MHFIFKFFFSLPQIQFTRHLICKYILFSVVFFLSVSTYAQSNWQWGKRGGSISDAIGYGPTEDVNDVTTDRWGNVYVVSVVSALDISIGSLPVTIPASSIYVNDICIASYKCDGTLRWFKMIVASQNNEGFAIKTDTLGGVYVVGRLFVTSGMSPNRGYILNNTVTDTTMLPFPGNQSMFLMKLDTGGAYKWFTMPEPDTLTGISAVSTFVDMDVDEGGNIYTLCTLKPGAYANYSFAAKDTAGWNVWNNHGEYLLKYDRNGTFQNGFHLPIRFTGPDGFATFIKRDYKRHRFYVTGSNLGYSYSDTISVAGTVMSQMFVACFDDACNLIWLKHDNALSGFGFPVNRPALDKNGNIYITGACTDSFAFNGSSPFINHLGGSEASFLVKMDTNGNNVWATNSSNDDGSSGIGVAVSNDTVAVFGYETCTRFLWGSDTIGGTYLRPYLARFNVNTGATIAIDTIDHNPGSWCAPGNGGGYEIGTTGTLTADRFGNFYGGGYLTTEAYIAGDTLVSVGGFSDWFVAKFGTTNCSVPIPVLSVNNQAVSQNIAIYPNPATTEMIIENAEMGSNIKLFNMMGQSVYAGAITSTKQIIITNYLVPGSYMLQLIGKDGSRLTRLIEKQ